MTDTVHTKNVTISVERIGVNTPPRFLNCAAYAPSIPEGSKEGSTVTTVKKPGFLKACLVLYG